MNLYQRSLKMYNSKVEVKWFCIFSDNFLIGDTRSYDTMNENDIDNSVSVFPYKSRFQKSRI